MNQSFQFRVRSCYASPARIKLSSGLFQGEPFMAEQIKCARCGERREALGYAPFPNEVGQRIGSEICQQCWKEWLPRPNMIHQHYSLDPMKQDTAALLFYNMKAFFFGGARTPQKSTTQG